MSIMDKPTSSSIDETFIVRILPEHTNSHETVQALLRKLDDLGVYKPSDLSLIEPSMLQPPLKYVQAHKLIKEASKVSEAYQDKPFISGGGGLFQYGGANSQFAGSHSQVGGAYSQFGGPHSQFGGPHSQFAEAIDNSTTNNARVTEFNYGDNNQFGGSRDVYEGSVDRSQHTTLYGDYAQSGGSRYAYRGNVDQSQNKTVYN